MPSGLMLAIEQSRIDACNETALSFTVTGLTTDDSFSYQISDGNNQVGDNGPITSNTPTKTVTDVDVSNLAEGTLTLTVQVADNSGNNANPLTASIEIINVNDAPQALADQYQTDEGALLQLNAANGVLANDSDIDANDVLTVELVSEPTHASNFTLNPDGSFSYRHDGSETRTDSFSYQLTDGTVALSPTLVSLTVAAVNDAPVFDSSLGKTSYVQGEFFRYMPLTSDPDSVVQVVYSSGPDWLTFDGTQLSGQIPVGAAAGSLQLILTAQDQDVSVTQTIELTISERVSSLVDIAASWQGLPALVDESLTLMLQLTHSAGPAVNSGELLVAIAGQDIAAEIEGCSATGNQLFTCDYSLAAAQQSDFKLMLSRASAGDIVVEVIARDDQATDIGHLITDASISEVAVAQSNNRFNLAGATSIASIDVGNDGVRELVAGSREGAAVSLLRYQLDGDGADVIGTIANLGNTRQVNVADINADGIDDVLVVNRSGDGTAVYYQAQDGSFAEDQLTQPLPYANASVVADLDNDGWPELILGGAR